MKTRFLRTLAATVLLAAMTGCATCEKPPAALGVSSKEGDATSAVDLNAPGPHQINVLVTKKDNGSHGKHHDLVTVSVESDGNGNYMAKEEKKKKVD